MGNLSTTQPPWYTGTVNQLLFALSLFCDVLDINWFPATYFCDQNVRYLENKMLKTFEDWFSVLNIPDQLTILSQALQKCFACN